MIESFKRSSGMFYLIFRLVDRKLKFMLLKSLCMGFYDSELCIDTKGLAKLRKEFAVSYLYALRIFNLPKRISSLVVCMKLNMLSIEQFLNYKVFIFNNL